MAYLFPHTGQLSDQSDYRPDGEVIWIYAFGETHGRAIKFGHTKDDSIRDRLKTVNRDQMTDERYVLLAAVRGTRKDEDYIKSYFEDARLPKGTRTEYFAPTAEVVEYVAWLRRGWWATTDADSTDDLTVDPALWLPSHDRRVVPPASDPSRLVQEWDARSGQLAGTAWSWMPDPKASFQDYFTPPEIVDAARTAMGDIDLDAASHWAANKVHRIPDYFDVNRSAFQNPWHGRVWLNPPYGNNEPWFRRLVEVLDRGDVAQVCMLSPVWVFNTALALETIMPRVSGMILLAPTPKFWGNSEGKTGKNHPHAVVYIGDRSEEFFAAFRSFGIPFSLVMEVSA